MAEDPTPDPDAPEPTPEPQPDAAVLADKLTKANAEAKRYRLEAKANADQLAQLTQQSMSDNEKAIAIARAEARSEALRESGARLVDAEVRAAVGGRSIDVKALLEGLDRTRFLDDDGEPNVEAITKWVDRIAPPVEDQPAGRPRVPAGVRTTPTPNGDPAQQFATFIGRQLNS